MYVIVAGGGKVGANVARSLLRLGHEVTLIGLRNENREIVEVQTDRESPVAGKRVEGLKLPEGARLSSVMRDGLAEIAVGSTELQAGDQVLAILEPGKEDELRRVLLNR